MTITTKTGDNGYTSLWSGQRLRKDDIRVSSYGSIDELNSFLNEVKHYIQKDTNKLIIEQIQTVLKRVMGELASIDKEHPTPIVESDIDYLEILINVFEKENIIDDFADLGKTIASSKLDVCRTIVRRSEREIVKLAANEIISELMISYMNRLSDLIFLMAISES